MGTYKRLWMCMYDSIKIIIRDCNVKVGNDPNKGLDCIGVYGEDTLNKNGRKMIQFCVANEYGNT